MKMSVFANPNFFKSWTKIYSADKEFDHPGFAYRADILNEYLMDQAKKFYSLRDGIVNKYANKDENGKPINNDGQVTFPPEHVDSINKEFAELMETDLYPSVPLKLKGSELKAERIKLSGPDVSLLKGLLEFEQD